MWFYRVNKNKQTKKLEVVWNTWMSYAIRVIGAIGIVACFMNWEIVSVISLSILAVMLVFYLVRYGTLVQILHIHEKRKTLEYKGSRFSFKDPLRVIVPLVRGRRHG